MALLQINNHVNVKSIMHVLLIYWFCFV